MVFKLASWPAAVVLAASVAACGGGGGEPAQDPPEQSATPPAAASLPPVTSRYVHSEGSYRNLADPARRSNARITFEEGLFALCNVAREMHGQPPQALSSIPIQALEAMDRFATEQMYDAATGAGREVHYHRATLQLPDMTPAQQELRAPDCLRYTVISPVETRIWASDGYRYQVSGDSAARGDRASRRRMGGPDDFAWRRLPTDANAPRPRRMVQGWFCLQAPRFTLGGMYSDRCHLEPDGDISFRNLPLALEEVAMLGVVDGQPTESTEEMVLTPTLVTTDRQRFGQWATVPVDQLPELAPGVTVQDRP